MIWQKQMVLYRNLKPRCHRKGASVLSIAVWPLIIFAVFCSCGTAKVPDKRKSPSSDLFCEQDIDCTVLNYDVRECCQPSSRKPYAISRTAVERYRSECSGCIAIEGPWHIYPSLEGCDAICVDHVCEGRCAQFSGETTAE
jgi:hypothetical protein